MKKFYSFIQKITEYSRIFAINKGNVLMFHSVGIDNSEKNISISVDKFKLIIDTIKNEKGQFLSLDKIWLQPDKKNYFITFDDIFISVYKNAFEILTSNNIPFAIFICVGLIGQKNYIDKKMLLDFVSYKNCTIGAHTLTHPKLRFENRDKSYKEIAESKVILENLISKRIEYFAYPYGSLYACSRRDIDFAKKAGYAAAFSTINSYLTKQDLEFKYFMPRININNYSYRKVL